MTARVAILHFVQNHGFAAWFEGDSIRVVIPWVKGEETGEETFTVKTMAEAREALGY